MHAAMTFQLELPTTNSDLGSGVNNVRASSANLFGVAMLAPALWKVDSLASVIWAKLVPQVGVLTTLANTPYTLVSDSECNVCKRCLAVA